MNLVAADAREARYRRRLEQAIRWGVEHPHLVQLRLTRVHTPRTVPSQPAHEDHVVVRHAVEHLSLEEALCSTTSFNVLSQRARVCLAIR